MDDLELQIVHGQFGIPIRLLLGADLEISKSAAPRGKFGINQVKLSSDLMRRGVYTPKSISARQHCCQKPFT